MELSISIRSSDPNVVTEIRRAKIAEGITIRRRLVLREMENAPIDFILYIGEHVVLPVAASLIARMLYDKLKGKKDNELTIQNQPVEINVEKIEQLIFISLKEKEE